jgi:hypothetical protein
MMISNNQSDIRTARQLPEKVGLRYGAGCPLPGCCAYPGAGLRLIKRAAGGWHIDCPAIKKLMRDIRQCTRLDRIINCFVKSNSYFWLLMQISIFSEYLIDGIIRQRFALKYDIVKRCDGTPNRSRAAGYND